MVLADSILQECRRAQSPGATAVDSAVGSIVDSTVDRNTVDATRGASGLLEQRRYETGSTVVAVLGMAHVNGVKKLLLSGDAIKT